MLTKCTTHRGREVRVQRTDRLFRLDLPPNRPDLLVNVSLASQTVGKPTIKDIVDLNRAVKMLKDTADCPHPKLTWESCTVGVFADSSFANTSQMKSQCGYIIGLTIPEIKDGGEVPFLMSKPTPAPSRESAAPHWQPKPMDSSKALRPATTSGPSWWN